MSSSNQSNRLNSFGTNETDPIYQATVHSIKSLSPSIKQFLLTVNDPSKTFRFQSGMFLDFHLPPSITSIITGFSICNSPSDYSKTGLIELAIKATDYPPTTYMFHHCQLNETIAVKPGGDFTYQPSTTANDSILLICAGIGGIRSSRSSDTSAICISRVARRQFRIGSSSSTPQRRRKRSSFVRASIHLVSR